MDGQTRDSSYWRYSKKCGRHAIRRSRVGSGTTTTTAVMIDCDPLVVVLMTKTRWWLWIA